MDDWQQGEHRRAVLRNVAAYRDLCQRVRSTATGGLLFGAFMLGIWWFLIPPKEQFGPFGLIYLGLAGLEFAAALWNKVAPSAEGVAIDGIVLLLFGGSHLVRQAVLWQAGGGGRTSILLVLFGCYWVYQGVSHLRSYWHLRRAFAERPTAEHMRWFEGLVREARNADPANDDDALDLATRPPVRGKLLGDTAVFVVGGTRDVLIVARDDVRIDRTQGKDPDRGPDGYLVIEGEAFGRFPLDGDNWRNYAKWKGTAGDPPVVGPAGSSHD